MDRFEAMNSVRRVERPGDGSRLLVVGCDGSPASRNALAFAVGLSRRERAHLVVVVVREPNALIALAPWAVEAELRGADVVIVGRRRGWRRRGATAAKLLRHARCTVIAVA